jgi:hypothetical protein
VGEGRFLSAVGASVKVSGQEVPAVLTQHLLSALNPIIDVEHDLGLSDWLFVTSVEVGQGILTVRARVTIPVKK